MYVTHKIMISCICTFLQMKMCNVHFSFTFSEFEQLHIKRFKREVQFHLFLKFGPRQASTDDK